MSHSEWVEKAKKGLHGSRYDLKLSTEKCPSRAQRLIGDLSVKGKKMANGKDKFKCWNH